MNDRLQQATPFAECFTGKVSGLDVDYGAITAPATATKIAIEHEETGGKVSFRIFIDGDPVTAAFTGDPPGDIPVVPGATYQFQMRPALNGGSGERTYVLRVKFQ